MRCLESWLLSDQQAIIDAMRGVHGVRIGLSPIQTESLTPQEAAERIAHLIRQVGQNLNNRELLRTHASSIKRRGKFIAQKVDLSRARNYNRSLDYFCDIVQCTESGCAHPCPE